MPFPRIRLRLSLRMLMLMIAFASLWMGLRVNKARRQLRGIAQVEKYEGFVGFDYEFSSDGKRIPNAEPWAPKWLRRALGNEHFREVSQVAYIDQPLSDAIFAPLSDLNTIDELCFETSFTRSGIPVDPPAGLERLTEAGLSRLESLTCLRRLRLGDLELTGTMLRHLNHSYELEELSIHDSYRIKSRITDEGMPPLGTMPRLRFLSLICGRITGSCLEPLRGSRSLEELRILDSPLSAAAFDHIGTITNLKRLAISRSNVNDKNLFALRNLTGLTSLDLAYSNSKITDAGLVHLARMTQLDELELRGAKLTGKGLAPLREMKQLKKLVLMSTLVDDAGLEVIAGLTKLEILWLGETKITDAGLVYLKSLKNLRDLSLSDNAVTPQALKDLEDSLPLLTKIRSVP